MSDKSPSGPNGDRELSPELVAELTEKSRLSMKLSPSGGQLLQAKTLGGTLTEFANLLEALGEPLGMKSTVVVESVTTDADGSITITVLAMRLASAG